MPVARGGDPHPIRLGRQTIMTAPTLMMVVRVILIVIYCPRADVRWMLTDLGRDLRAVRFRLGTEDNPEGEAKRVKHEPVGQTLGYYPRL